MITTEDRMNALVKFLNEEGKPITLTQIEESNYDDCIFETSDEEEYLVVTDEEADERFEEEIKNLFEDGGLQAFPKWIIENNIDSDQFFNDIRADEEEVFLESPDSFESFWDMYDIKSEIANLYIAGNKDVVEEFQDDFEMYDEDNENVTVDEFMEFLDEYYNYEDILEKARYLNILDDFVNEAVDNYFEEFDSAIDYLENMYGNNIPDDILENYVDWEGVADDIKQVNGRGEILAFYDGIENEIEYDGIDFYIYRLS